MTSDVTPRDESGGLPADTAPQAASTRRREPAPASSARARLGFLSLSALAGLVLGIPAGWLWVRLSNPPQARLTGKGVYFGEVQLNQEVGLTLWFLAIGLIAGAVVGILVTSVGYRHGLVAPLGVLVACAVGAAVSAWLGIHVFGASSKAQVASAQIGALITDPMSIGTAAAYLGWPIGGMVGAFAGIVGWPKSATRPEAPLT